MRSWRGAVERMRHSRRRHPHFFLVAGGAAVLVPFLAGIYLGFRWIEDVSRLSEKALRQHMELLAVRIQEAGDADSEDEVAAIGRFDPHLLQEWNEEKVGEGLRRLWSAGHGHPTETFALAFPGGLPAAEPRSLFFRAGATTASSDYRAAILAAWREFFAAPKKSVYSSRFIRPVFAGPGKGFVTVEMDTKWLNGQVVGVVGGVIVASSLDQAYLRGLLERRIPKDEWSQFAFSIRDPSQKIVYASAGYTDDPSSKTELRVAAMSGFVTSSWTVGISSRGGTVSAIAGKLRLRNYLLSGFFGVLFLGSATLLIGAMRREFRFLASKAEFIANLSHELKTPLTLIRLSADTIRLGRFEETEVKDKYCEFISQETARLTGIVDRILLFARGERNLTAYKFQHANLGEIAADALRIHEPLIAAMKARTRIELDRDLPPIWGDPQMLVQAIQNLLDNALKYSGQTPEISISVRRGAGNVSVEVRDAGQGIPSSELDRIFEPFFRLPTAGVHDVKGAGLGLTLVRQIVRAHGGSIEVESRPGAGSLFALRFPLSTASVN